MNEKPLSGQTAVITGASRGLGLAVTKHLAAMGADIVMIARDHERLSRAAEMVGEHGGRVLTIACDVASVEQVRSAADRIAQKMQRADILINNAGIPAPRTFADTTFADWDAVIGVNLSGVFYMTRALWDLLTARGGYVITISGTAGVRGGGSPAYGSAKFGLTGLNHAIATAGKEHGVRATILYPGSMDTGWRGAPIGEKPPAETMSPDEVARYVGYLVTTPKEFVVNEAVLNPIASPFL